MKTPYDYDELLKSAGANVLAYKAFGSYQGDWIAKVEYQGKLGYIKDYFGSCSGCDALQAEFDYADDVPQQRVVDFALTYLNEIQPYEVVLAKCEENISWDMESQEMVNWLKNINQMS